MHCTKISTTDINTGEGEQPPTDCPSNATHSLIQHIHGQHPGGEGEKGQGEAKRTGGGEKGQGERVTSYQNQ